MTVPYFSDLEAAWNHTSLPQHGFPWHTGIWPVLAGFIGNKGVARYMTKYTPPEGLMHPSGNPYWPLGHEVINGEQEYWVIHFTKMRAHLGHLHLMWLETPGIRREQPVTREDEVRVLDALIDGISDAGAIAERVILPQEKVRDILAHLVELGTVTRREDGTLTAAFPVFQTEDIDILAAVTDKVAKGLVQEKLLLMVNRVPEELQHAGYGHLASYFPVWISWQANCIVGEAMHALLQRGILPNPGNPTPATFCLFGWLGGPQAFNML